MSIPIIQTAFVTGEVTPSLFGHVDLARMHSAAATFRNGFVGYRGGFYSRAGTKFVGFSKQTGRAYPPRLIPFQFSINQGIALEFGHLYMRPIVDGGFVTENPVGISAITQANPAVFTLQSGITSATPNDAAISASYAPGDTVTLAGGTFTTAAVIEIVNTKLLSLALNSPGIGGYSPGDTINLSGGTQSTPAQVNVLTTKVVATSIGVPGNGSIPNGVQTAVVLGGSPGGASAAQIQVVVAGGVVIAINAITAPGIYTANPPALAQVVIGGNPSAFLNLAMGVNTIQLTNPGVFTANAGGGTFTQASTTGGGLGATFNTALFGPNDTAISNPGQYTVFPASPAAQGSTSGTGVGVTFTIPGQVTFANGDWVFLASIGGMTALNGETGIVTNAAGASFRLTDVYGTAFDTSALPAYSGGGTAARIYTLGTPWAETDLPWLKYTQSADVMTLCCVNQQTLAEYPAQDLARLSDTNWTLSTVTPAPSVGAPGVPTIAFSSAGAVTYQFQITAVSPIDGTESIASPTGQIAGAVNIAATAGTLTVSWAGVAGVNEYNIYKATPGVSVTPPIGALFGYAGTSYGTQFLDSNIVADFSQVPPTHRNPFARGQAAAVNVTAGGAAYTDVGFTINTTTGSGLILEGVLVGGALSAVVIRDRGQNYKPADTITVTSGSGVGATVQFVAGPQSGTYPGVVAYFQQRRGYAYTVNNPDTYFFSQPGAYGNFDSRIPTIASDAIVGTPWAVQVDGIQFMTPMPGGLIVHTGLSAWLLSGAGGGALNPQPIEPASQQAAPQGFGGCSATVPPVKIEQDVLQVQSKGYRYLAISYQIQGNIYGYADITINSSHLFTGFTILEHAWCEEPFKLLWAVRSDGLLLSDTYLRAQEVNGWARSDTQGLFQSVCSVTEPPVDALYAAVQRFPGTHTAYTIERMDNRLWRTTEDVWAVDCALALSQPAPAANLTADTATGLGAITGATGLVGGQGYSAATTATVVDDNGQGPGTGAIPTLTILGGVITAVTFAIGQKGTLYRNPALVIRDPAGSQGGSGASARLTLDNTATFTASAAVFAGGDIGKVIRMNGGKATITAFLTGLTVLADIVDPLSTVPDTGGRVLAAASDNWTMTAAVTTISGLKYLAGATVTGLADGNVIPPTVVPATGIITLAAAASSVTVGLKFTPQLQSVYLDAGAPTVQGQRKKIADVTVRVENSRGVTLGTNQPDGSTLSPMQVAPEWTQMTPMGEAGLNFQKKSYNSTTPILLTGDSQKIPVFGGYGTRGQIAAQQDNPWPMNILAFIPDVYPGDTTQTKQPQRGTKGQGGASNEQ